MTRHSLQSLPSLKIKPTKMNETKLEVTGSSTSIMLKTLPPQSSSPPSYPLVA